MEANPFHGTCTIPAGVNLAAARSYIELEGLAPEAAASITVNGQHAGGVIGKPFRLDVSRHLKAGTNTVGIAPFAPQAARLAIYPL